MSRMLAATAVVDLRNTQVNTYDRRGNWVSFAFEGDDNADGIIDFKSSPGQHVRRTTATISRSIGEATKAPTAWWTSRTEASTPTMPATGY